MVRKKAINRAPPSDTPPPDTPLTANDDSTSSSPPPSPPSPTIYASTSPTIEALLSTLVQKFDSFEVATTAKFAALEAHSTAQEAHSTAEFIRMQDTLNSKPPAAAHADPTQAPPPTPKANTTAEIMSMPDIITSMPPATVPAPAATHAAPAPALAHGDPAPAPATTDTAPSTACAATVPSTAAATFLRSNPSSSYPSSPTTHVGSRVHAGLSHTTSTPATTNVNCHKPFVPPSMPTHLWKGAPVPVTSGPTPFGTTGASTSGPSFPPPPPMSFTQSSTAPNRRHGHESTPTPYQPCHDPLNLPIDLQCQLDSSKVGWGLSTRRRIDIGNFTKAVTDLTLDSDDVGDIMHFYTQLQNATHSAVCHAIDLPAFADLKLTTNFQDLLVPDPSHPHYGVFLLNYNTLSSNIQSSLCKKKTISTTATKSALAVKKLLHGKDGFQTIFTIIKKTIARLGGGGTGRNPFQEVSRLVVHKSTTLSDLCNTILDIEVNLDNSNDSYGPNMLLKQFLEQTIKAEGCYTVAHPILLDLNQFNRIHGDNASNPCPLTVHDLYEKFIDMGLPDNMALHHKKFTLIQSTV